MRYRTIATMLALATVQAAYADESAATAATPGCTHDSTLTKELERRHEKDQQRLHARKAEQAFGRESAQARELWAQQARIDADNLAWLDAHVREHGWPATCAIGENNATAFFLIAQHGDAATQKPLRIALEAAVERKQASPRYLAYLDDRIRVAEGKPQRYGTQWTSQGDLYPVEDAATLDARRAAIGLGPAADFRPGF